MIDKADLIPWRKALESQYIYMGNLPRGRGVIIYIPSDREKFRDLLSGGNQLLRSALEKRIEAFIANGTWGELSGDEAFYMTHRLTFARQALESLILHSGDVPAGLPQPPSPNNASEFWRWLLIELWETPLDLTTVPTLRGPWDDRPAFASYGRVETWAYPTAAPEKWTLGEARLMKFIDEIIIEEVKRRCGAA